MKRALAHLLGLVVLVLVVLAPAALYGETGEETTGPEETTITRYVATFDVDDEGEMDVVETLTVDFPSRGKHGIFRFFDRSFQGDPTVRWDPRDVEVTMDGDAVPFEELDEGFGRYTNVRIGDPDATVVPGEHVYRIGYTIDGVLLEGTGEQESELYWNLVPGGWRQEITRSRLTVTLPAEAQAVQCAVGAGASDGCEPVGTGTRTLEIRTGHLDPNTPVTVRTGLDIATPSTSTLPWSGRFDQVLGTSVEALVVVLVLAALAGAAGFWLARRAREADPRFPLVYAPPEGIGPAQAAYLVTEEVDDEQYVATLLHAAQRGAIDLDRQGRAWTITDRNGAEGWSGLDPVTSRVAHLLGGPGTSFAADPDDAAAGKRLKDEIASFDEAVAAWGSSSGLVVSSGLGGLGRLVIAGLGVVTVATVFLNPFGMSALALVPGLFVVLGAGLASSGAGTRRTRAGRDLWSRAGGFRRTLSTPSAQDRFDFSGREELYTAYIPWAVAFGCAEEWAGKYRIETGAEPPVPTYVPHYYSGAAVGSAVSSMTRDFQSTVSSAISSYEATQKSSSSSSGGGFSGGGGGGGGGGGSW
jgi:Predicted membrane protein (DUF2207)